MPLLTMRHDFRAPDFGPASTRDIYSAALEQFRWADAHGFDFLVLSEHHAIPDGWMPAPLTIAAAALAMTRARAGPHVGIDPPLARSGTHRRADRGDRQRLSRPLVDRRRCGLPRRRVRDGGHRARTPRQDPRGVRAGTARRLDRRTVRVPGPHDPGHAATRDPTAPDVAHRRWGTGRGAAGGAVAPADDADEHRRRVARGVPRRSREDRVHGRLRDGARRPDLRPRHRGSRPARGPSSRRTSSTRPRPTRRSRRRASTRPRGSTRRRSTT